MKLRVLIIMLVFLSCTSYNDERGSVTFKKVLKIGDENGIDSELIGLLGNFSLDDNGNLYLLDVAFKNVKIVNSMGKYIKTIGKGEGQGPGEFIDPMSVDTDSMGNIYVADQGKHDFTIFNKKGDVIKIVKSKYWPNTILLSKPFELFSLGFPLVYHGGLIIKYNFNMSDPSVPEIIFCDRQKGKIGKLVTRSGYFGCITKNGQGDIFYAFTYPYEIRRFSDTGELLGAIKREVPFFKSPYLTKEDMVRIPAGIWSILFIDKYLMCVYFKKNYGHEKFIDFYFDIWDIEQKQLIASVPSDKFNISNINYIKSDGKEYVYIASNDPYPHIDKFKVTINRK